MPGLARTSNGLTLMAVHAHPDDEVLGTGGVLARYSEEGVRTVLVTCTNGEQGDGPEGAKPGEPGHNAAEVAATRLAELRKSASLLGVTDLELLGYRDSGMVGWAANADPGVFCNVPLAEPAERVAALMRQYQPQVVVTYDANGGYGHPDHIQAHRATVAAAAATGIPVKFYYSAIPKSAFARLRDALEASGPTSRSLGSQTISVRRTRSSRPRSTSRVTPSASGRRSLFMPARRSTSSSIVCRTTSSPSSCPTSSLRSSRPQTGWLAKTTYLMGCDKALRVGLLRFLARSTRTGALKWWKPSPR